MKKIILLLSALIMLVNISDASFPVKITDKEEITIYNSFNQNPWYISVKNAILFLATSVFGLAALGVFISVGFIASDREASFVLLLIPLLFATAALFASVFYGKRIWGDSVRFEDRLSKKILIWTVSIATFFFLLASFTMGGSGMGG